MIDLSAIVQDSQVASITGQGGSDTVRRGFMSVMRKALAVAEKHHKRQEWITGTPNREGRLSGQDTHPEKLTLRSGTLLKSYRSQVLRREMAGAYGSHVEYSRIHEFGGRAGNALIPARPGLKRTIDAKAKEIEKILADGSVSEF